MTEKQEQELVEELDREREQDLAIDRETRLRESKLEDYIANFGDEILNEVRENYESYGLTFKDIEQSSDNFNQEVCNEIVRSFDESEI
jgi:hypothetical protein